MFLVSCAPEHETTRAEVEADLEEAIANVSAGKASILKVELRRSKQVMRLGLPQGALTAVELDLFDADGQKINPNPILLSPTGEAVKLDLPKKYTKDEAFTVAAAQNWQSERLRSRKIKLINPLLAGNASFMTTQASLYNTTDAPLADATATDATSTATTDSISTDSTTTTDATSDSAETTTATSEDAATDTASADATSDTTEATTADTASSETEAETEDSATTDVATEPAAPAEEPLPDPDPIVMQDAGVAYLNEEDWKGIQYEDPAAPSEAMGRILSTDKSQKNNPTATYSCKRFVVAHAQMEADSNRFYEEKRQYAAGYWVGTYHEHWARIWGETQSYVTDACGNRIIAKMATSQWVRFNEGDKIMEKTLPTRSVTPDSIQHICSILKDYKLPPFFCKATYEAPVYTETGLLKTYQESKKYIGRILYQTSLDDACHAKSHHKFRLTISETVPAGKTALSPELNAKGPAKPQPAKPQPAKPQGGKPATAAPAAPTTPSKPTMVTRDKLITIDIATDYSVCHVNTGDISYYFRLNDKLSCASAVVSLVESSGASVSDPATVYGALTCGKVVQDMTNHPEDYQGVREREFLRRLFPYIGII